MERIIIPENVKPIVDSYYANNAKQLYNLVDKILFKLHFVDVDKNDFYSLANEVFMYVVKDYDSSKSFDGFLYSCLYKKFCTEMTRRCRKKRMGDKMDISIDTPIGDDEKLTIGDLIQSDFNIDNVLFENTNDFQDEKVKNFLDNLPFIQRKILEMKMEDVPVSEIKEKLGLGDNQYNQYCQDLKSFTNISILFGNENLTKSKEDDTKMKTTTQTAESCKTDKISIASIIKKIDKHTIRFDHPLQRESDQWSPSMKGNLISDILQGNKLHPLIFAEQIINGVPIIWDLDGKQRCTNAYSFSKNGYKVSKNIRRWMIKYQTTEKDENGSDILDENGFPIAINAEFDIRGKKFSDLPEELRDRFLDYSFNYDQYLNCSEEDIGYHIERYNDGKAMTVSQKGITKLGTEYAEIVKSISNMPFFKDIGGYKVSEYKNGTINRVVVESVMASHFLDDWKDKQDYLCKYLKENATVTDFDNFEDMVGRLEKVVTNDVADMFDSKDSFLWFGLFAKFINTGEDDNRFIEFMTEFDQSLHTKEIDGTTYDELCINKKTGKPRATKDKYIVIPKMVLLEKLMNEFLGISELTDLEIVNTETFIAKHVDLPLEEVTRDIDCYESTLNDLQYNTIKDGSKLLDTDNRLSLLSMVAYSFKNEVDLDDWMTEYAKKNNMYYPDQKKNYLHMKSDFEKYLESKDKISA